MKGADKAKREAILLPVSKLLTSCARPHVWTHAHLTSPVRVQSSWGVSAPYRGSQTSMPAAPPGRYYYTQFADRKPCLSLRDWPKEGQGPRTGRPGRSRCRLSPASRGGGRGAHRRVAWLLGGCARARERMQEGRPGPGFRLSVAKELSLHPVSLTVLSLHLLFGEWVNPRLWVSLRVFF